MAGLSFWWRSFFTAFTDMLTGFFTRLAEKILGLKANFVPFILYAAVPAALIATLQFIATTFLFAG